MLNIKKLLLALNLIISNILGLYQKQTPNQQWSSRIVGDQCVTAKNKYLLVQHCQQELSIQTIYNPKTKNSLITEATNNLLKVSKYWKFSTQERANIIFGSVNENKIYIMRDCIKMLVYKFDFDQELIYLHTNITFPYNFCGAIQSTSQGVIVSDRYQTDTSTHYFVNNSKIFGSNQQSRTLGQQDIDRIQNLKNITSVGTASEANLLVIISNCFLYKTTQNFQIIDQQDLKSLCFCDQAIRIDSQNEQGTLYSIGCFNPKNQLEWRYHLLNELDNNQENWLYLLSTYPYQRVIESSTAITTYKDSSFYITTQAPNYIYIDLYFEGVKNKFLINSEYKQLEYQRAKYIQEQYLDYLYNEELSLLIVTFDKNETISIPLCKFKYQKFPLGSYSCELCPEGTFIFGLQRDQCENCRSNFIQFQSMNMKLDETLFCIKPNCQYANKLGYFPTYNETFFLNNDGIYESLCSGPQMVMQNKTSQYKCDYNCIECQTMNPICRYSLQQCQYNASTSIQYNNIWNNSVYLNCPGAQGNFSYSPTNNEVPCNFIKFYDQSTIIMPRDITFQLGETIVCRREYQLSNVQKILINSLISNESLSKESLSLQLSQQSTIININQKKQSISLNTNTNTNLILIYSVKSGGFIGGFNITFLKQTQEYNNNQTLKQLKYKLIA